MFRPPFIFILLPILVFLAGWLGYLLRLKIAQKKLASAEELSERLITNARQEAKTTLREARVEAKDEALRIRQDAEKKGDERLAELRRVEKWLGKKELQLDKRESELEDRSDELKTRDQDLEKRNEALSTQEERLSTAIEQQTVVLEELGGLSAIDAKRLLLENLRGEVEHESARMIKEVRDEATARADDEARRIITGAIQRMAGDHVSEVTVSVVPLPNDEMKGRVIGREGRNIRAFEMSTGVDVVVDDTPEAIILSSFDPVRREVARQVMEKLVHDGRIHPARIEDLVTKTDKKMKNVLRETGEQAALDAGVPRLHPEIIHLLGRLRYRTSFGQNVLQHSLEVSYFCGMIAEELGLNAKLARRAGLLHDIGKAIDHEVEGTHAQIGADHARRYKEKPKVINAIEAHHGIVEPTTAEAVLVMAADALSAARPGARRETLDLYLKRLRNLEEIANTQSGVKRSFAIQAGREIRIIVDPGKINDLGADEMAHAVARQVENDMEYPGKIKVTVIREHRSTNFAT